MKRKNGLGNIRDDGYICLSINYSKKLEHIMIAERALGKDLPIGSQVHHIDGNRSNNSPDNLIICPSNAYHHMIHQRMRAYELCGNANHLKCKFCKKYDDPKNLRLIRNGRAGVHRECEKVYQKGKYKFKDTYLKGKEEQNKLFDKLSNSPTRSKAFCKNGHEFTKENTYMMKIKGGIYYARCCRKCKADKIRNLRAKSKS